MTQLSLFRDWHEARVAEAEKRCLDAIKAHKERRTKYERVFFYRTAQLRREVARQRDKAAA